MKCTAHFRIVEASTRCERKIGHAGLHRIIDRGYVQEFGNASAVFPNYRIEGNLNEEPETTKQAPIKIEFPSRLPYQIAMSVIPQGTMCDELAREIRRTLSDYIGTCALQAKKNLIEQEAKRKGEKK